MTLLTSEPKSIVYSVSFCGAPLYSSALFALFGSGEGGGGRGGGGHRHLQGWQVQASLCLVRLASAQGQTESLGGARALLVNLVGGDGECNPRESKQDFGGD